MDTPIVHVMIRGATITALICIMNAYAFLHEAHAESKWELMRNSDGVLTYSRQFPGSRLNEYKSMTVVNAGIEVVGEALRDIPAQPQWMHTWAESRIVKKFDRNNLIFYAVIGTPFPAQDRDLVVSNKTTYDLDMGRAVITARPADETLVPPRNDRVRMTDFEARFSVEFIGRDKTGIVYQYRADPGGNLPSLVVNIFTRSISHDTLVGLKKLVQNGKYAAAARNSEDRAIFNRIYNDRQRTKRILKNRLGEYVKNRYIIELMLNDETIVNMLVYGEGEIAEFVFMSSGSRSSMTAAAKKLLSIYLKKFVKNDETISLMLREQRIIDMLIDDEGELAKIILNGGGSRQSVVEAGKKILAVYLRKFIKNEEMIKLITNERFIMDMILDDRGELAKIVLEGNGSRKSLLEAGKKLLGIYLKQYIKNDYTIALMLKDDTIIDMLMDDNGEIARTIIKGKGSRESVIEAGKKIFAGYLRKFIKNEDLITLITNEKFVIDAIIDGGGDIAKIVYDGNGSRKSVMEAGKKLLTIYLKKYIRNEYTIALIVKDDSVIDMLLDDNGDIARIIARGKGSRESVIEAGKKIFAGYLRKFIKNEDLITLITNEKFVMDMIVDDKGDITKIVYDGNGSRESLMKAGKKLLAIYLKKYIKNDYTVALMLKDDALIDVLLDERGNIAGILLKGNGSKESVYSASKKILAAYLKKYISNEETISLMVKEDWIIDMLLDERGEIAKIIVQGNGSRESVMTAGRKIFSVYLRKYLNDERLIEKIVNDDTVINMLMRNRRSGSGMLKADVISYIMTHYRIDDAAIKSVDKL